MSTPTLVTVVAQFRKAEGVLARSTTNWQVEFVNTALASGNAASAGTSDVEIKATLTETPFAASAAATFCTIGVGQIMSKEAQWVHDEDADTWSTVNVPSYEKVAEVISALGSGIYNQKSDFGGGTAVARNLVDRLIKSEQTVAESFKDILAVAETIRKSKATSEKALENVNSALAKFRKMDTGVWSETMEATFSVIKANVDQIAAERKPASAELGITVS